MTKMLERKIIDIVRRTIAESIQEALNDPDHGLELTVQAHRRLMQYRRNKKHATVPFEEITRLFA